ncbi:MAG TPA: hypothetical protein VF510_12400, partial [Ktedonobacterales bacterium]
TLIGGHDLGSDAMTMTDRAAGRRNEPGEILATANTLAALITASREAPYGEQDLCLVFDDVHPVQRGFDLDDLLDDLDESDSDDPASVITKPYEYSALVALFARPAPRMEAFDHGVFDDEGNMLYDDEGEMLEGWVERSLQHFLVLCDFFGESFEDNELLLAALRRAYGEPLESDSRCYD